MLALRAGSPRGSLDQAGGGPSSGDFSHPAESQLVAGTPKKAAMLAELHTLAVGAGLAEDDNGDRLDFESSVMAYICAWMRGVEGQTHTPTLLGLAQKLKVSRFMLENWVRGTPERAQQYKRACELSSHNLAEEGLEILEQADGATSKLANMRAGYRRWLAGVRNREEYGTAPTAAVAVSVADLHLHAFDVSRSANRTRTLQIPTVQAEEIPLITGATEETVSSATFRSDDVGVDVATMERANSNPNNVL